MTHAARHDGPSAASGTLATNAWLAEQLLELAARLELAGTPHAPRAYRRAAESIEQRGEPIVALFQQGGEPALEALPGIGSHIAGALAELIQTGRLRRLERLRSEVPIDVMALLAVDGIGIQTVKTLWETLGVRNLVDLEAALETEQVQAIPRFGPRRVARLRDALHAQQDGQRRFPLAFAREIAEDFRARIAAHPSVSDCHIAGSIRRRCAQVGDIDLVAASTDAGSLAKLVLGEAEVVHVYSRGPRRVSIRLGAGIDLDLRIVSVGSLGAALLYFTGSRQHTLALRRLALAEGLRLNEYGLYRRQRRIAGRTEASIYEALALPCIPPEQRLGGTEIRDALLRTAVES